MSVSTVDVIDGLLAHGRFSVSTAQAAELLGVPDGQVRARMHRMVQSGRVFSPARGLWVAVPPEFRSWGVLPGTHFVDALMAHLSREYYVGWLSAAELHGAAHQRPQEFQVAVDRHVADREVGRVRMRFHERRRLHDVARQRIEVQTGEMWVSTAEVTAGDLATDIDLAGGVSNAATVLAELAETERIDSQRLLDAAQVFPLATSRRLGYLLDLVGFGALCEAMHAQVNQHRDFPADLLVPGESETGSVDARWRLRINADVEPDL
ncbi:MAG: hypothetical protein HQ453_04965 [Actinobacteria bacterium]|nr:hypothetical protein [Actinomycetota bacterium]